MSRMTPLDIENLRFRTGFRGYNRDEVERFRADALAAVEDYIALAAQLSARVAALEAELSKYHDSEELLKNSVVLAQRTCDELIAAAHQRADAIERQARVGEDEIRRRLAELKSEREQFEYAFYGLLSGFMHRLEQTNPALAPPAAAPALSAAGSPAAPTVEVSLPPAAGNPGGVNAPGTQSQPSAPALFTPAAPASAPETQSQRPASPLFSPPAAHAVPGYTQPRPFAAELRPAAAAAPSAPADRERDSDAQAFAQALASAPVAQPAPWPPAAAATPAAADVDET